MLTVLWKNKVSFIANRQSSKTKAHILTGNGLDRIGWWCSKYICNDRQLVDMVFPRKQRFAVEHLGQYAPGTPNINLCIILLPGQHDFGGAVVSRGNVSGHPGSFRSCQAEIADLQVAIFVNKDIVRFQVPMNDAS